MSGLWLSAVSLLLAPVAGAAELPIDVQALVLVRALGYDRALEAGDGPVEVALVAAQNSRDSRTHCDAMSTALASLATSTRVSGRALQVRPGVVSGSGLEAALAADPPHVLYACPDLEDRVSELRAVAETHGILTIGSEPAYVRRGLCLGVTEAGGKPRLLANPGAVKRAGHELSAQLLGLAEIVD